MYCDHIKRLLSVVLTSISVGCENRRMWYNESLGVVEK